MSDIEFGVRITADNRVFIDGVQASTEEVKKLGDGLRQVSKDSDSATRSQESLTGAVVKGTFAYDVLVKSFGGLVNVFRETVEITRTLQQDQARVEAVIMATGRTAELTAGRIEAFQESIESVTKFSGDAVRRVNAQLLTFASLTQDQIERVIRAGADLAQVYNMDLAQASLMIAKAMTETGNAIGPLERKFGDLDSQTRKHIITLREMGEMQEAGNLILQEVEQRVGGAAVESYRGLERQITGARQAYGKLLESLGVRIFDAHSRDASGLERALVSMREKFEANMRSWDEFRSRGWVQWFTELRLAMLGVSLPPPPNERRGGSNFASGQIQGPNGGPPVDRGLLAEIREAGARWDELLGKLDKGAAMEREIAQIKALGEKAGKTELETQRAIALIREKYLHTERDAAREQARARREAEQAQKREVELRAQGTDMIKEMTAEAQKQSAAFSAITSELEDQVQLSELEARLVGQSTEYIAQQVQELQARQRLERSIVDMTEEEKAALRAQLETTLLILRVNNQVVETKREIARITAQTAHEQAATYGEFIDRAMDFVVDFAMNGQEAVKRLRQDLKLFLADMAKLAGQRWLMQIAGQVTGNANLISQAASAGSGTLAGAAVNYLGSAWSAYQSGAGVYSALGLGSGYTAGAAGTGQFANVAGGASSTAPAGGGGMASTAVTAAWIAAIVYGIYRNDRLFEQGWRRDNQDSTHEFWAGPNTDRLFRGLGMNDYWASMFSGSSLTAAIFGHRARQNDAYGLMGTIGGDGITGQAWQDWSRQGGTFRSDIRGTDVSDLTAQQGDMLSGMLSEVGDVTSALGRSLGVNVAQALAGYSRDFNVQLSNNGEFDPTELVGLFTDVLRDQAATIFEAGGFSGIASFLRELEAESEELAAIVGGLVNVFQSLEEIDLGKFLTELHKSPTERLADMGKGLIDLASKTKLSADSLGRLAQSTNEYKNAVAQLVAAFESAKNEIDGMFRDTAREIRLAGMSGQERYNFLQDEAQTMLGQIGGSTNVEEIRAWAAQINSNIVEAFNLLSPEEQHLRRQEFLNQIDATNRFVRDRLSDLQETTVNETNTILMEIKDKLDLKAEQFKAAADTQMEAAIIQRDSAIQVDVDVRVFDDRATAAVVNGG